VVIVGEDRKVQWKYDAPASDGWVLPNGNVLITESSAGRAFEVSRQGEIVWDFFNPEQGYSPFAGGDEEVIGSIYRVVRVSENVIDGTGH